MIEAVRKQNEELRAKISETEVERWTKLVDVEREQVLSHSKSDLAYHIKVQQATREDATTRDRMLRNTLIGLNKPIVQMSDQILIIQDRFNSSFSFASILQPVILNSCQEKSEKKSFAGCPKSNTEVIMMTSRKVYCPSPASGYLRASISLSGDSRACPLYSGFMAYVRDIFTLRLACD